MTNAAGTTSGIAILSFVILVQYLFVAGMMEEDE